MTLLKIILFISISGMVIIALGYVYNSIRGNKSKKNKLDVFASKPHWKTRYQEFAQKSYSFLMRIPVLKGILARISLRIETLAVYDMYNLREAVMTIVFRIFAVITLVVLSLIVLQPGWLVVFWILLGLLFVSGIMLDFFVYRVENRLLKQQRDFNNRVRFYYTQTKMVDEAIFESMQFVGPEMKVQADRMYQILTSADPTEELNKYDEVAPNEFLKIVAGLAVTIKEQGDRVIQMGGKTKGSAFLQGLTAVNQLLNSEILLRAKLSYRVRYSSLIALTPVFLALPLQKWGISSFPIMETFYTSRLGFLAEILVYGVAILSYLLIRKISEITEAKYRAKLKKVQIEKWLFEKVGFVRTLAKIFSPAENTKQHLALSKLLKDANSPLKVEWLTIQRMLIAVGVFLLLVGGLSLGHAREKHSSLYSAVPQSLMTGNIAEQEMLELEERAAFDRRVIEDLQKIEGLTPEKLQSYVAEQLGVTDEGDKQFKATVNRITDKWVDVENAFLKWWEVLISFVVAFGAAQIPILILNFQRSIRYKDMENEVYRYLVILNILKEFERTSVFTLLTWLERFGIIFKEPLQEAIQNYDAGPEEALEKLNDQVSFEPFQQIVERLKLAVIRISVYESFNDIEMEREYYLEQREEANFRSLNSKGMWANKLAMAPLYTLTFLYLVIPLVYLALSESVELFSRIQ